jgi:hypothetical protein
MAADDFQHFIDQHPSLFVAVFPVHFITLWFLVGATTSFIGGWYSLVKVYRTRVPFHGGKWGGQSGRCGGCQNFDG